MFSVDQKRRISEQVQRILRETKHPELPPNEIQFLLHVDGRYSWSWTDIRNNGAVANPEVNPWNELQAAAAAEPAPAMSEPSEQEIQEVMTWLDEQIPEDCGDTKQPAHVAYQLVGRLAARARARETAPAEPREVLWTAAQAHIDALEAMLAVYRTGNMSRGAEKADKVKSTREKWAALAPRPAAPKSFGGN